MCDHLSQALRFSLTMSSAYMRIDRLGSLIRKSSFSSSTCSESGPTSDGGSGSTSDSDVDSESTHNNCVTRKVISAQKKFCVAMDYVVFQLTICLSDFAAKVDTRPDEQNIRISRMTKLRDYYVVAN